MRLWKMVKAHTHGLDKLYIPHVELSCHRIVQCNARQSQPREARGAVRVARSAGFTSHVLASPLSRLCPPSCARALNGDPASGAQTGRTLLTSWAVGWPAPYRLERRNLQSHGTSTALTKGGPGCHAHVQVEKRRCMCTRSPACAYAHDMCMACGPRVPRGAAGGAAGVAAGRRPREPRLRRSRLGRLGRLGRPGQARRGAPLRAGRPLAGARLR